MTWMYVAHVFTLCIRCAMNEVCSPVHGATCDVTTEPVFIRLGHQKSPDKAHVRRYATTALKLIDIPDHRSRYHD